MGVVAVAADHARSVHRGLYKGPVLVDLPGCTSVIVIVWRLDEVEQVALIERKLGPRITCLAVIFALRMARGAGGNLVGPGRGSRPVALQRSGVLVLSSEPASIGVAR